MANFCSDKWKLFWRLYLCIHLQSLFRFANGFHIEENINLVFKEVVSLHDADPLPSVRNESVTAGGLLYDQVDRSKLLIGLIPSDNWQGGTEFQGCIGSIPADLSSPATVLYGDCTRPQSPNPQTIWADGVGTAAEIYIPMLLHQTSQGDILFIDNDRCARRIRDDAVTTFVGSPYGNNVLNITEITAANNYRRPHKVKGMEYIEAKEMWIFSVGRLGLYVFDEDGLYRVILPFTDYTGVDPSDASEGRTDSIGIKSVSTSAMLGDIIYIHVRKGISSCNTSEITPTSGNCTFGDNYIRIVSFTAPDDPLYDGPMDPTALFFDNTGAHPPLGWKGWMRIHPVYDHIMLIGNWHYLNVLHMLNLKTGEMVNYCDNFIYDDYAYYYNYDDGLNDQCVFQLISEIFWLNETTVIIMDDMYPKQIRMAIFDIFNDTTTTTTSTTTSTTTTSTTSSTTTPTTTTTTTSTTSTMSTTTTPTTTTLADSTTTTPPTKAMTSTTTSTTTTSPIATTTPETTTTETTTPRRTTYLKTTSEPDDTTTAIARLSTSAEHMQSTSQPGSTEHKTVATTRTVSQLPSTTSTIQTITSMTNQPTTKSSVLTTLYDETTLAMEDEPTTKAKPIGRPRVALEQEDIKGIDVTFRILAEFSTMVGPDINAAKVDVRTWLSNTMNVTQERIASLILLPGSVVVVFSLMPPTADLDTAMDSAMALLNRKVESGDFITVRNVTSKLGHTSLIYVGDLGLNATTDRTSTAAITTSTTPQVNTSTSEAYFSKPVQTTETIQDDLMSTLIPLLRQEDYSEENIHGDYLSILAITFVALLAVVIMVAVAYLIYDMSGHGNRKRVGPRGF